MSNKKNNLGKALITRMIGYRCILLRMQRMGFTKVFSTNLADAYGVTSEQVRKDFSAVKIRGNKRGGYGIQEIIQNIQILLGKPKERKIIVVGVGNIGTAIIKYNGFLEVRLHVAAGFDTDKTKQRSVNGIKVLPISELSGFVRSEGIKIGIIAVPEDAAQNAADLLVKSGIKGILNFAPVSIKTTRDIVVSNINFGSELETIGYFIDTIRKVDE